jgi:F-type H+-transporting ATPase subunit a
VEEVNNVLFSIGPLEVTRPVVTMWVIIAVLAVVSFLATRNLKDVPGPLQNLAEMAVGKLRELYSDTMSPKTLERYLPALGTFFIFILACNYSGLLPGAGKAFAVPTASLSVTAGLAVCAFFYNQFAGIRAKGVWGHFKTLCGPSVILVVLMLPLNLIEQVVRPFSLAMRLYGNIFGEETVVENLGHVLPLLLPLLMQVLSLLFGVLQAMVFTSLLAFYVEEATEISHD